MIAKAGRNVAPLGEKWLIRSAAGDVAADGHSAEGATVIALPTGHDTKFLRRARFEMKLAGEFDGGFGGFRAAGGEVDAAIPEILRREREKTSGKFFSRSRVELRGMCKGNLRSLSGHRVGNRLDSVTDVDDGGLAGSVEILLAVG